jgi:MoaA/NifB/PqqE/SkfB family radical SAM enzyme
MPRDNILSKKSVLPAINITFGGGLGCNVKEVQAIIQIREEHPEWFYDNVRITSIFDCFPGMIWNGGRPVFGSVSLDEAAERVNFFNQRGIGVNFTFTNCFLKPEHLADPICNQVLKMFENPMNGIIINSALLEAHIRKTCPSYKMISSVTKVIYDQAQLLADTAKYDLVVIPPEYNHDRNFLSSLPSEKVELSIMDGCRAYCKNRLSHFKFISQFIINQLPQEQAFFPGKCDPNHEMDLSLKEMLELAANMGINNFKCGSRGIDFIQEPITSIFIKPQYVDNVIKYAPEYKLRILSGLATTPKGINKKKYLYETIKQEIDSYPLAWHNQFNITQLSLEITKCCTNTCIHCSNYGSPQNTEQLDLPLIKQLVDQAVQQQLERIHLWGGEPFLHPDLYTILQYTLQKGLSVSVNTNAFWAKSQRAVEDFCDYFITFVTEKHTINLDISCDYFHQSQKATPLQNIVNLISVLAKRPKYEYNIQSVITSQDNTFTEMLLLLHQQQPTLDIEIIRQKQKAVPLEQSVGRAKQLPTPLLYRSLEADDFLDHPSRTTLFITSHGDVVLYENWVGDSIYSLGNVKEQSLVKIIQNLHKQKMLKFMSFIPVRYFFYPFRKYLNLEQVGVIFPSKIIGRPRDAVARLMQITEKQFDKSVKLEQARRVYYETLDTAKSLDCLDIIDRYGDFLDVFALRYLLRQGCVDIVIKQKISELLGTTYKYNTNTGVSSLF